MVLNYKSVRGRAKYLTVKDLEDPPFMEYIVINQAFSEGLTNATYQFHDFNQNLPLLQNTGNEAPFLISLGLHLGLGAALRVGHPKPHRYLIKLVEEIHLGGAQPVPIPKAE